MVFISTSITVYPIDFSESHKELSQYSQKVGELAGAPPQYTVCNEMQGEQRVPVDLSQFMQLVLISH